MPPRSTNKKKNRGKNIKSRDRNTNSTSCYGCSLLLENDNYIHCICTQIRYCSDSCKLAHPHNGCSGKPAKKVNLEAQLKKLQSNDEGRLPVDVRAAQAVESKKTVQGPFGLFLLSKRMATSRYSVWDLAKWADEGDGAGNQACAYLAGTHFKHRLLGKIRPEQGIRAVNKKEDDIPVLESQELAFKYFEKAAKLGHGLAMQSLGCCFEEGVGCKENRRRCNQWLWRACLQHSIGAIELIDDKSVIPLEIGSNTGMMDGALRMLQPGQGMNLGGPNLASLLLVFHEVVQIEDYTLPAFAGKWASGTVNNPVRPRQGLPRIPLIGSNHVREFVDKLHFLESQGRSISMQYCRRGTAKQATAQTRGATSRSLDSQIFLAPPFAACDERVTDTMVQEWHVQCRDLALRSKNDTDRCAYFVTCIHNEGSQEKGGFCQKCEDDARERLDAIARGSLVLSLDEELPHRGHAAIFRGNDGTVKIETWKYYCVGEAECVLAVLVASGLFVYVSPLFIAQDPNFLYPLIYDHGSIRAALEFVAPHIDWNENIGPVKENVLEQVPLIPGCQPGKFLRKCGNGFCTNLEKYKTGSFQYCSRCNRRKYCSSNCQRDDWVLHKHECVSSNISKEAIFQIDNEQQADGNDAAPLKHEPVLEEGEDCVIHGLISKPQYNAKVGVIGKTTQDGRVAVTLRDSGNVLSVKTSNLYCIGAFCKKRKKKSRVFECMHGNAVCKKCYLDFTTINILAKLKYNGQDMTSEAAIEQCQETHFSSCKLEPSDDEDFRTPSAGWPFECAGMEEYPEQRLILKALLETKSPMSLLATVARTAYITYGGAFVDVVLRGSTKLEDVAECL